MSEFKWEKMQRPSVTRCCGSLNWTCTEEGDLCHECDKITPDNLRVATALDLRLNGAYVSDLVFEEMYQD